MTIHQYFVPLDRSTGGLPWDGQTRSSTGSRALFSVVVTSSATVHKRAVMPLT